MLDIFRFVGYIYYIMWFANSEKNMKWYQSLPLIKLAAKFKVFDITKNLSSMQKSKF